MNFFKKNKKVIIIFTVGIVFILSGVLSWNLYFSKFKIFEDQEKDFLEAVERYFEFNVNFLPKKNETKEITLQDLYDGDHISSLYVPKTRKLCDPNSWVRVYQNDNGEYEYLTYLKCGKFESDIDSEGPVITLNGKKQTVIALGSNYQELGVSKVVDKVQGKMNVKDVIVDNSKVNTNKIGTYKVTYTVRDKAYNKTVVTRTVVVAENLTQVVRDNTDDSNYYRGSNVNNYLLFSGMLFRIVNVNEDGTIKLISNEAITNLRADYDIYEGSNIDTWLKNVYYKSLNNADKYLVDSTYCVGDINSVYDYSGECSTTITSKVGLLNISQYNSTISNNSTYLDNNNYFTLSHKSGTKYIVAPYEEGIKNGLDTGILAPIRPVITLKSNLYLLSGDGTKQNPFKLDDYSYANKNDLLNTRLVGEYVQYSGLNFRINKVDDNKNVRVIMTGPWKIQPSNQKLQLAVAEFSNVKFNVKDQNSPAFVLNNDYLDFIDTESIVDTNYIVPKNVDQSKYNSYKTTKVKAKILLPTTYEMFAAPGNDDDIRQVNYMYIDSSNIENAIYMVNGNNGLVFEMDKTTLYAYHIKALLTLNGKLKISKGNGTINNPYILK